MRPHRVITVALALALACSVYGYAQQTAEELYQAGLYQEEVQGDLENAIDIYRRILTEFSENRTVGAKAQLHVGLCYEKLGLREAQQAYRRVIDDFPEHTDEVVVARDRLAGLERALAELDRQPTFREIEIASKPQNGVLSPDGNKLAFVSDGSVWVVPLHGKVDPDIAGEPVRLADLPDLWDNGSLFAWSANGEWIAVNSRGEDAVPIYLIPTAGGEPRLVELPDRGGHPWSRRLSLSPDGRTIAFSALAHGEREEEPDVHERVIYSIPAAGGEPIRISSGWGRLPSFSPDGERIAYVGYRERDDWPDNPKRLRYDGDLWVASSTGANPVRLATVDGRLRGPVWSPDGKYIAAHHEPATDNSSKEIWVFPSSPDVPSVGGPVKVQLPRESLDLVSGWTPNGELGVFIQAEQHQAIYTVPASGGKAVQVSDAGYAWYPRWSSDGERIYARAIRDEETPMTLGYVPSAGGDLVEVPVQAKRALVGRVPGGGFNVSPDGEKIVMSAYRRPWKPEEGLDLWAIPLDGGPPIRLTRGGAFEGYPCWSPDGTWVAFIDYEQSEDGEYAAIYTVPAAGGEARQLTAQSDSIDTGAIAVSPDGERIAFLSGGAIKTIPAGGGEPEVLIADAQSGWRSDLAWSPDGTKIAYSGGGKIWIASAEGGDPEELSTGLPEEARHGSFSWSPDGQKIAFIAWMGGDEEFWLISDFLPTNEGR